MFRLVLFFPCLVAVLSYRTHNVDNMEIRRNQPVSNIQFNNCNTTAVPIYVRSLNFMPQPMVMGNTTTMSADLVFSDTIGGMISYAMDVKVYDGSSWEDVCGYLPVGFCSGNDVCTTLLTRVVNCPTEVQKQGSNCQCPIAKNEYKFESLMYLLPPVPGCFSTSLFNITLQLTQNGKQLSCVSMILQARSC